MKRELDATFKITTDQVTSELLNRCSTLSVFLKSLSSKEIKLIGERNSILPPELVSRPLTITRDPASPPAETKLTTTLPVSYERWRVSATQQKNPEDETAEAIDLLYRKRWCPKQPAKLFAST
jgi:hypothetical protein